MHQRTQVAAVAAVLGALTGLISGGTHFIQPMMGGRPGSVWLLLVGTSLLAVLVSPVAVFALGYVAGQRNDVPETWLEIAAVVGIVGALAHLLCYVVIAATNVGRLSDILQVAIAGGFNAVVRAADFAVTSLAGAAVAHFRSG